MICSNFVDIVLQIVRWFGLRPRIMLACEILLATLGGPNEWIRVLSIETAVRNGRSSLFFLGTWSFAPGGRPRGRTVFHRCVWSLSATRLRRVIFAVLFATYL